MIKSLGYGFVLFLLALPAWSQCSTDSDASLSYDYGVLRTGDNQIYSYAWAEVTGNTQTWFLSVTATVEQNGGFLHALGAYNFDYATDSDSEILQTIGPGTFTVPYSEFDFEDDGDGTCDVDLVDPYGSSEMITVNRPTISGVNAFWWLGSGVLSDGAPGPVYYAQTKWTSNGNGASATPYWYITPSGSGDVDLDCNPCSAPEATAASPSSGCIYDIIAETDYGGFFSLPFYVAIIKPSYFTQVGSPANSNVTSTDYSTVYTWSLQDTCDNYDAGLDGYEQFGTFYSIVSNNWGLPTASNPYVASYFWTDTIGASVATGQTMPAAQKPGSPLSTVEVVHDTPYGAFVGTNTFTSGVNVHSDDQQWFQDHGIHQ